MTVYILFESYHNFDDSWDTVVDVYLNKDDADAKCQSLEQTNGTDRTTFYVLPMETK